jgi:hypothetical protein
MFIWRCTNDDSYCGSYEDWNGDTTCYAFDQVVSQPWDETNEWFGTWDHARTTWWPEYKP